MKLIPKSHFDNLRLNDAHEYDSNESGGKRVVKVYAQDRLIAKAVTRETVGKTKKQYFGVNGYDLHLNGEKKSVFLIADSY